MIPISQEKYQKARTRLIHDLKKRGYIKSRKVENAMLTVPREYFLPSPTPKKAYTDTPQSIGRGQTISAPHMVAIMCEELELERGQRILEIGGGQGYHAAVVSRVVGKEGSVTSCEIVPELSRMEAKNLKRAGSFDNVYAIEGDGVDIALEKCPFDRIYLTAASPDISSILLRCLDKNGILLMPVKGALYCELTKYRNSPKGLRVEHLGGCSFVPLTGEYAL